MQEDWHAGSRRLKKAPPVAGKSAVDGLLGVGMSDGGSFHPDVTRHQGFSGVATNVVAGRRAIEAGLPSVHAFPMVVRSHVVGTLNLFMDTPGPLPADDVVIAQALAHAATVALLQNQAIVDSRRLNAQLQGALNSRVTIEQAKGVLSGVARIGTDEAFVRLRSFARNHNTKLTEVSAAVANRTLPDSALAELTRAG